MIGASLKHEYGMRRRQRREALQRRQTAGQPLTGSARCLVAILEQTFRW